MEIGAKPGLIDLSGKHMDIYKITNIPKYRSFQYRLLQRGLVTNIHLYKWGLADSDKCSFCQQESETVPHMLATCVQATEIWQNFVVLLTIDLKVLPYLVKSNCYHAESNCGKKNPCGEFSMFGHQTIHLQVKVSQRTLKFCSFKKTI